RGMLGAALLLELGPDPRIRLLEPRAQRDARLPPQNLSEQVVVAVATSHALRLRQVVALLQLLARDLGDHVDELVDGDELVGAEIDRLAEAGLHESVQALDAVVDVAEASRLFAVSPDVDLPAVGRLRDLAGDGGRRFLLAAFIGAERTVDVVEADDPDVEPAILVVIGAELLGEQLL